MESTDAQQFAEENPEQAREAQEQMQEILARSARDPEFREKLLSDPHAAIEEHTGEEMPEDMDISFIENQGDATLVLPDYQDPEAELEDDELEAVAGGADTVDTVGKLLIALGGEIVA